MKNLVAAGANFGLVDQSLEALEAGNTTLVDTYTTLLNSGKGVANYQKLINEGYSQATLNAYISAAASPFTNPYDNMLDGGVTKDVIEALTTIPGLGDASKLSYSIIANIRKDLSIDALKAYTQLHKEGLDGTNSLNAFFALNDSMSSDRMNSADTIAFAAFASRNKNLDKASYDAYTDLQKADKSNVVLSGYEDLIRGNASAAKRTAFSTLVSANASDKVMTAFNRLNNDAHINSFISIFNRSVNNTAKEAWLEELADYSVAGANDKLTVLNDLVNANYSNSRAFIAGDGNISRANTIRGLSNGTAVLPMLLTLHDANVNASTKDRLVTLAQSGASQTKLNAFTVINARKQAGEINALNNYMALNANDSFLQAFVDLVSGVNNPATARVAASNSLLSLKESIGARSYPSPETGAIKFAKYADTEMLKSINSMIDQIVSGSSSHANDTAVIAKVNSELAKMNQTNIGAKDQLVAVLVAAAAINAGLTNLDNQTSIISRSVDAKYTSLVGGGGGGGTTPPTVDRIAVRLQARINSYRARKANFERLLAEIPENSTNPKELSRRRSYEARIAATETLIANLEAQLDARTPTA